MKDQKQKAIVEQAIKGDEGAFIELIELKAQDILYICRYLMGTPQDGEDAAQDILLYIHKHITELNSADAFNVWMYRIVHGICSNLKKKEGRRMRLYMHSNEEMLEDRTEFLPYEFTVDGEKKEKLLAIIHDMPYKNKMCVLLFYYQNMKYEEIGKILELSKKDVDNALMQAKRIIKRELGRTFGKTYYEKSIRSVAAAPVMTIIFQDEVRKLAESGTVQRFLGASPVIKAAKMLNNSSGSSAASGSSGSSSIGAVKMVGLVVSVSAAVGGAMYFSGKNDPTQDKTESGIVKEAEELSESSFAEEESLGIEKEIRVLEDMLGEEPAVELRELKSVQNSSFEELDQFLTEQGMTSGESIVKIGVQEEYTLYTLEKQEKLLMVIVQQDGTRKRCKLNFHFTDASEKVPRATELWTYFDSWK